MTNTIAPATYLQVRKATLAYYHCQKCSKYVGAYRDAYNSALGQALLERCNYHDIERLRYFLKVFDTLRGMTIVESLSTLIDVVPEAVSRVKGEGLDDLNLVTDRFRSSVSSVVSHVFDLLSGADHIGLTAASKILAVINPALFVMWDRNICREYFPSVSLTKVAGDTYVEFLSMMKTSIQSVVMDAREHKIYDPEKSISDTVRQTPPLPMAKLIDNYNWIALVHANKCSSCRRAIL